MHSAFSLRTAPNRPLRNTLPFLVLVFALSQTARAGLNVPIFTDDFEGGNTWSWALASPACDGYRVGDACFVLAAPEASCSETCAGRGGYNEATRDLIGSDGSLEQCQAVASGLGLSWHTSWSTDNWHDATAIGCSLETHQNPVLLRTIGEATTAEASTVVLPRPARRICGCNEQPAPATFTYPGEPLIFAGNGPGGPLTPSTEVFVGVWSMQPPLPADLGVTGALMYDSTRTLPNGVTSVTYSEAGALFVASSLENHVYRIEGTAPIAELPMPAVALATPAAVASPPATSQLWAAGLNDSRLFVWRLDQSPIQAPRTVDLGIAGARAVAFSPSGAYGYVADLVGDSVHVVRATAGDPILVQTFAEGVGGVLGLDGPYDITVTPDGLDVYVSTFTSDSVVHFRVQPTGELTFVGNADLQDETLDTAFGVAASPDGRYVAAVGGDSRNVLVFSRDPESGELTGIASMADSTPPLQAVFSSPTAAVWTGQTLYIATRQAGAGRGSLLAARLSGSSLQPFQAVVSRSEWPPGDAIALPPEGDAAYVFEGSEWVETVRDPVRGSLIPTAVHDVSAFVADPGSAYHATASPDGRHIVLAGSQDLYVFDRSLTTGTLTPSTVTLRGVGGAPGLTDAWDLRFTPDGNHLYLVGDNGEAVTWLSRDVATGVLTHRDSFTDVDYLYRVEIGVDPSVIYTTDTDGESLIVLRRNGGTGNLEEIDRHTVLGLPSLTSTLSVAASPDGRNVYVIGSGSSRSLTSFLVQADGTLQYQSSHANAGGSSVVVHPRGHRVYVWSSGQLTAWRRSTDGLVSAPVATTTVARPTSWLSPVFSGGGTQVNLQRGGNYSVFLLDELFGDGFESADTSAWVAAP